VLSDADSGKDLTKWRAAATGNDSHDLHNNVSWTARYKKHSISQYERELSDALKLPTGFG
jgi:hypothetical protein